MTIFSGLLLICALSVNTSVQESQSPLYRPSELNEPCRSDKDCRNFGYVCQKNKTCQCDVWYIPNRESKKCVGGVNQKCQYDEHCIEGAFCMNQSVCKCKQDSPVELDDGLVCGASINVRSGKMYLVVALMYFAV